MSGDYANQWLKAAAEARALGGENARLRAQVAALTQERDDALSHCRGPMPSPERIAEAHSRLPADWFEKGYARLANHGVGHFAYHQGPEACYVCTLLGLYEAAEAALATTRQALTAICQGNDRGHWIDIYREAGGGYEGLQAIARRALAETEQT